MEDKKQYIPLKEGNGIYKELGSEFIACLFPLSSLEEFKTKEEAFRKTNPKADHYPYALKIGDYSKSSDDGEPSGTAGKAIAAMLDDKNLDKVGVLVARYFGGTKLGVPGLRRAFLSASKMALEDAILGERVDCLEYPLSLSYSEFEMMKSLANRGEFELCNIDFGLNVNLTLRSSGTIDGLLEKKGIRLDLPTPKETAIFKEVKTL